MGRAGSVIPACWSAMVFRLRALSANVMAIVLVTPSWPRALADPGRLPPPLLAELGREPEAEPGRLPPDIRPMNVARPADDGRLPDPGLAGAVLGRCALIDMTLSLLFLPFALGVRWVRRWISGGRSAVRVFAVTRGSRPVGDGDRSLVWLRRGGGGL